MNRRGFLAAAAAVFSAPFVGAARVLLPPSPNPIYGIRYGSVRRTILKGHWMKETTPAMLAASHVDVSMGQIVWTVKVARKSIHFLPAFPDARD